MSRTVKSSKGPGWEWWSRRPYAGWETRKRRSKAKRWVHKAERQQGKEDAKRPW